MQPSKTKRVQLVGNAVLLQCQLRWGRMVRWVFDYFWEGTRALPRSWCLSVTTTDIQHFHNIFSHLGVFWDSMEYFQDLRGSWCSTITTPTPSIAPNSTAESSLFVVRIESLMAPLNPRLMVSQMYLTLKGGLRADIKGADGVGGFWEGKEKKTIPVFRFFYSSLPQLPTKKVHLELNPVGIFSGGGQVGLTPEFIQIWLSRSSPPPHPPPSAPYLEATATREV